MLDAQDKKVDAYVTVGPKGAGSVLTFADTDAKGHYRLEFRSTADSLTVTASGLAIGNQVKIVANRSQRLNFRVIEKTMQLKEVSVRSQKIRQNGDTLNYLVGAYQRQYTRVNYSGLDIYTNTSQLRPRNIIGTIRFKLL